MSELYSETGMAKQEPVMEYIRELLSSCKDDSKMVVFAHHKNVIGYLDVAFSKENVCAHFVDVFAATRFVDDSSG